MLSRLKRVFGNPKIIILYVLQLKIFRILPDRIFLKAKYRLLMGSKLDLTKPKTFNEKQQWLKLYDRKPRYTIMADKYEVRKYVTESIGENYLIPLLGVYDSYDEIQTKSGVDDVGEKSQNIF